MSGLHDVVSTLKVAAGLGLLFLDASAWGVQPPADTTPPNIIQTSLDEKNYAHAKNLILNLAPEDRLPWIDALREIDYASPQSLPEQERKFIEATTDANKPGGGALPNFAQIIQLIENTVDGNWSTDGGSSAILPYQNGVRVDREGVLQRITAQELEEMNKHRESRPAVEWNKLGAWQSSANLRWISLAKLDQLTHSSAEANRLTGLSESLLGGLCRIDFVAWDETSQSWLLGGPAGDLTLNQSGDLIHRTLRLPPVLLEDVVAVGSTILGGARSFGCSIDPDEMRLQEAYRFSQTPGTLRLLRSQPKSWITQWKAVLGHQNARVFGVPPQTTTALALLVADAEMKRMAFEFDALPPTVRSYWQEIDLLNRAPSGTVIRWWYTLGNAPIPFDKERMIYRIPPTNVSLMSETQFFNMQGGRGVAALPDIAADAFARNFAQHHEEIQRLSPAQGRLRHIFDLAVAFELIRLAEENQRKAQFQHLLGGPIPFTLAQEPLSIESIAASHAMPNGATVAVVSGGVSIDIRRVEQRLSRGNRELSKIALPKWPKPDAQDGAEAQDTPDAPDSQATPDNEAIPDNKVAPEAEAGEAESRESPAIFWQDAPAEERQPEEPPKTKRDR